MKLDVTTEEFRFLRWLVQGYGKQVLDRMRQSKHLTEKNVSHIEMVAALVEKLRSLDS